MSAMSQRRSLNPLQPAVAMVAAHQKSFSHHIFLPSFMVSKDNDRMAAGEMTAVSFQSLTGGGDSPVLVTSFIDSV